jgi:hypothetical protein
MTLTFALTAAEVDASARAKSQLLGLDPVKMPGGSCVFIGLNVEGLPVEGLNILTFQFSAANPS